jgi:hypothetical protein
MSCLLVTRWLLRHLSWAPPQWGPHVNDQTAEDLIPSAAHWEPWSAVADGFVCDGLDEFVFHGFACDG